MSDKDKKKLTEDEKAQAERDETRALNTPAKSDEKGEVFRLGEDDKSDLYMVNGERQSVTCGSVIYESGQKLSEALIKARGYDVGEMVLRKLIRKA